MAKGKNETWALSTWETFFGLSQGLNLSQSSYTGIAPVWTLIPVQECLGLVLVSGKWQSAPGTDMRLPLG